MLAAIAMSGASVIAYAAASRKLAQRNVRPVDEGYEDGGRGKGGKGKVRRHGHAAKKQPKGPLELIALRLRAAGSAVN